MNEMKNKENNLKYDYKNEYVGNGGSKGVEWFRVASICVFWVEVVCMNNGIVVVTFSFYSKTQFIVILTDWEGFYVKIFQFGFHTDYQCGFLHHLILLIFLHPVYQESLLLGVSPGWHALCCPWMVHQVCLHEGSCL